jgi:hypothetical protein
VWEEYHGSAGGTPFIPVDEAFAFPEGAEDCFSENFSPANYEETVNTRGLAVYAKQERMKFDIGVELAAQSNPTIICNRPAVTIRLTESGTVPAGASAYADQQAEFAKQVADAEKAGIAEGHPDHPKTPKK